MRRLASLAGEDPGRTYVTLLLPVVMAGADWTGSVAANQARRRAEQAEDEMRAVGIASTSIVVGDVSPQLAIEDHVADHGQRYDAIVISTLPPGMSRWLRMDLHHWAERHLEAPVIHVVAESGAASAPASDPTCRVLLDALESGRVMAESRDGPAAPIREPVSLPEVSPERTLECLLRVQDPGQRMILTRDYVACAGDHFAAVGIVEFLRRGDAPVREATMEAAITLGRPAIPALEMLLHSESREVRWYAVEALRHLGGLRSVEALVAALEDQDFAIRWTAGNALIPTGGGAFWATLEAIAGRSPSLAFHQAARRVLERTCPEESRERAASLLASLRHGTSTVQSPPLARELLASAGASRFQAPRVSL